jgi:NADH-quinone oxidoreductase subunit J
MFLVLTIVWLAGLFVLLGAFFLGAVQILIYAGAVMVLFLFVIMLLDLRAEERRRFKRLGLVGGGLVAATLAVLLRSAIHEAAPAAAASPTVEGTTEALGRLLFTRYLLPFEAVSVLLLVAMVGVVWLSKKELK